MSRLIDADKIDFNEVFVGASEFAQDTRNAAQMLIDNQSTAFDLDKVVEQLETRKTRAAALQKKYASEYKYASDYFEGETDAFEFAIKIVKEGGVE